MPIQITELKKEILRVSLETQACHIGSALSCVEIVWDTCRKMKKEDYFVFSKASGVAALYVVLAELGTIPKDKVAYYLKNYPLPSTKVPGCTFEGGSLGHGLPFAVGLALSLKRDKKKGRVFCLVGDGDIQEGTTWESMLFRRQHKLDNLKVIYDANGLQAFGRVEDILLPYYYFLLYMGVDIRDTIKGKGVKFLENKVESHYHNLTKQEYEKAIRQLTD